MSYIQNKLDDFDERFGIKRNHAYFSPEYDDEASANNSNEVRTFIEQSLTDYHNHIVEKVRELPAFTPCSDKTMGKVSDEAKVPMYGTNYLERETVLSLLQDTNKD